MLHNLYKISELLKIPIESIVGFPEYVEINSSEQNVGSLPFYVNNSIITYDTDDAVLNKFRWDSIYLNNQNEIDLKIFEELKLNAGSTIITLGTFRVLYVKDNGDNLLYKVRCSFVNGEWQVYRL